MKDDFAPIIGFSVTGGGVSHFTVEVIPEQGQSVHTDLDGHVDQKTKKGTLAVVRRFTGVEASWLNPKGKPWEIKIDDATAGTISKYMLRQVGTERGTYHPLYNSCANYVWDVLNLARKDIPDLPAAAPKPPAADGSDEVAMFALAKTLYKYLYAKTGWSGG